MSICNWELSFYVLDKSQVNSFIKLLIKEQVDFNFEYENRYEELEERHYVTICGSWSTNLKRMGELLEEVSDEI